MSEAARSKTTRRRKASRGRLAASNSSNRAKVASRRQTSVKRQRPPPPATRTACALPSGRRGGGSAGPCPLRSLDKDSVHHLEDALRHVLRPDAETVYVVLREAAALPLQELQRVKARTDVTLSLLAQRGEGLAVCLHALVVADGAQARRKLLHVGAVEGVNQGLLAQSPQGRHVRVVADADDWPLEPATPPATRPPSRPRSRLPSRRPCRPPSRPPPVPRKRGAARNGIAARA